VSAAQHHFEALAESQEKTFLCRHDMRHHLNLINSYLEDDNKASAKKYITSVENAIIACGKIENVAKRTLKITSKIENNKLFIEIVNSFDGTIIFVDDLPMTKEENHGLGIKSIVAVVLKYDGVYAFTAEDNVFKAHIIVY
jgi:hypothetical protein